MPSLPTDNDQPNSSYDLYRRYLPSALVEQATSARFARVNSSTSFCKDLVYIFALILVFIFGYLVVGSAFITNHVINASFPSWYESTNFYLVFIVAQCVLTCFLNYLVLYLAYSLYFRYVRRRVILCIILPLHLLLGAGLASTWAYALHHSDNDILNLQLSISCRGIFSCGTSSFSSSSSSSSASSSGNTNNAWSLFNLFLNVLYPSLFCFLTCVILHCHLRSRFKLTRPAWALDHHYYSNNVRPSSKFAKQPKQPRQSNKYSKSSRFSKNNVNSARASQRDKSQKLIANGANGCNSNSCNCLRRACCCYSCRSGSFDDMSDRSLLRRQQQQLQQQPEERMSYKPGVPGHGNKNVRNLRNVANNDSKNANSSQQRQHSGTNASVSNISATSANNANNSNSANNVVDPDHSNTSMIPETLGNMGNMGNLGATVDSYNPHLILTSPVNADGAYAIRPQQGRSARPLAHPSLPLSPSADTIFESHGSVGSPTFGASYKQSDSSHTPTASVGSHQYVTQQVTQLPPHASNAVQNGAHNRYVALADRPNIAAFNVAAPGTQNYQNYQKYEKFGNNSISLRHRGNFDIHSNRRRSLLAIGSLEEWENKILKNLAIFWTLLAVLNMLLLILANVSESVITKYLYAGYAIFLIVLVALKGALKWTGRRLDILRHTVVENVLDYTNIDSDFYALQAKMYGSGGGGGDVTDVSFELFFVEFAAQAIYFANYRFCTVYYVTGAGTEGTEGAEDAESSEAWEKFAILVSMHFCVEIFESCVRASGWWFGTTSRCVRALMERNSIVGNIVLRYFVVKDDCNRDQWAVRHYLDLMVRFVVGVVSAAIQVILLLAFGKDFYGFESGVRYWRALCFVGIQVCSELTFFAIVVLYQWHFQKKYVWKPMYTLIKATDWKLVVVLWCVLFVWLGQ